MRLGYGTGGVDFQSRVDHGSLRKQRLARLQAELRADGLPAALVTRPENIRYATGLRGPVFTPQLRYALVLAEAEPIVFEMGDMLATQRAHAEWIPADNWRSAVSVLDGIGGAEGSASEARRFAAGVAEELRARGLLDEPIGVDALDEYSRAALSSMVGKLEPLKQTMVRARTIKTPQEVRCIRLAIDIANVGYAAVLDSLKPGVRESDVGAAVHGAMIEAGAENTGGRVRSGPHTYPLYHIGNTDRRIEPGDLVQLNTCSTSFNGYKNCLYRNYICGRRPNTQEAGWATSANDRVQAVISEIRPGATTADAARHLARASERGYSDEQALLAAELGHGYGMGYDPPLISRSFSLDHPQVFEAGMVIAVECIDGESGKGGIRIEEMVLVTDSGTEQMSRWPSEEVTPVATYWG